MQLTLVAYLLPHLFTRWSDLQILLSVEDKLNYLEHHIPAALVPAQVGQQVALEALAAHAAWVKGSKEIELKTLFAQQAKQELLQTIYIDNLERLDQPVSLRLVVSLILISLSKEYDGFMQNYNMHSMGKTVNELHDMIKLHEQPLPKKDVAPTLQAIRAGRALSYAPKPKNPPPPKKENPAKDVIGHQCGEVGHWRRNCPIYLVGLLKKKKLSQGASTSGKIGKRRKPYSHQVERAKDLLGLILTDVCGPFMTVSRQGASYFVTFTNDFSHYGYIYLLKHKHEVFETFKVFKKEVENQLGKTIKSLRSDRGGEYMSQEFLDHLKEHRIITHRTPPYTPQHNGVSERRNRTLLDIVRSIMSQTTLPKSFWDYALETISRRILEHGYPKETMGYSFYYPPENKVFFAQNAEFFKNSLITQEASGSLEDLEIIQEEDTHPSIDTSLHHDEDDQEIDEPQSDSESLSHRDLGEPANYKSALLDPEFKKWLDAMNVEMQSMKDNDIWDLVDLPPNGKTIGRKWLFKKKIDMDGAVHTFKAREAAYILGIKIYQDRSRCLIGLCQSDYIEKILKRYFMENSKRGTIPMQEKLKLSKSQGDVDWKSTKQSIFVTSSTEAENILLITILKSCMIQKFISRLGVVPTIEEPISMYCKNTRAIAIAKESRITKGARHYCVKVHYMREVIEFGDVKIEKVHTDDNLVDPFTKALPYPKHSGLTKNIGMIPASSLM
ncbi:retrotransposon protein, putative, ty1-copia subclass [Tanacetum coccineum]|uniref:Retrotransposon protein, putative, ty1-copia subclass n=1 Tax=Tanacetum coccineum TaxID=301880 RepID=A0ABQ4Z5S5_9ASTR